MLDMTKYARQNSQNDASNSKESVFSFIIITEIFRVA